MDEAILRALSDGGEKPERLALEPWLYHLAIRSLNEIAAPSGDNSKVIRLEESTRQRNVAASDEAELQFHQPDESFTEETVTADPRMATPEEFLLGRNGSAGAACASRGESPRPRSFSAARLGRFFGGGSLRHYRPFGGAGGDFD